MLSTALALLVATFATLAADPAGVRLNEVYVAHVGVDDREMIELTGAAGGALDGYVVCAISGEAGSAGVLIDAWSLAGHTIPNDGFFVLGDAAVGAADLDLGPTETLANGTTTYCVVHAIAPGAVMSLVGTNVDADGDGVTSLGAGTTKVDAVALVDAGFHAGLDSAYDDAPSVGPDGAALPAGVYRAAGAPGVVAKWCASFLDPDDVQNASAPRTPGAVNGTCPIRTYGRPRCAGPGGFRVDLRWAGDPTSGTGVVSIDMKRGPGGAAVGFFFGVSDQATPMAGGCDLLVGPPFLMILHALPGVGPGNGTWQNTFPIPAGLSGVVLVTQAVMDGGNGTLVDSNGIEIELL